MSSPKSALSVPLPKRVNSQKTNGNGHQPPVWSVEDRIDSPTISKCDRHAPEREGVCCKDLKGEDERQLVDPDIIRDCVIGLSDGLTVPFALAAGLSSLGESRLVILGGVAELIAGCISMGVGGFLASQAERDHYLFLKNATRVRVERSCEGEVEREVHRILGPLGLDEETSRLVAQRLREIEVDTSSDGSSTGSRAGPEEAGLKWNDTVGLTAFLLKFAEGAEYVSDKRMYISAFTIGMGYLVGGFIPLIPYFFIPRSQVALIYSSIITGIVLLIFGAVKARVSGAATKGIGGYVWGAVSTLLVGGAAAAAAFGIVAAIEA